MEQQTKKCPKCGGIKTLDEFYKQKGKSFGRCSHCKICMSDRQKERTKIDPERRAQIKRKSNMNHRDTLKAYRKKRILGLEKHYVIGVMRVNSTIATEELVELGRQKILIHRATKQLLKTIKEKQQ